MGAPSSSVLHGRACPEDMVEFGVGEFIMGAAADDGEAQADERPARRVRIDRPYCLDRTEVTVAAYLACVNDGACTLPSSYDNESGSVHVSCTWHRGGYDRHPVNCVDWRQARAFCMWAGHAGGSRRLPTEYEWEYAARGREGRRYAWGNALDTSMRANFCGRECGGEARGWRRFPNWEDPYAATAPVGSFPEGNTPEGLSDMTGNVAEWLENVFVDLSAPQPRLEEGPLRAARGGSWVDYVPARVRASQRDWFDLMSQDYAHVGIRCARDI